MAPVLDSVQNWNIQNRAVINGSRVATFSRDLVTGDPGDGSLVPGVGRSLDLDIPVGVGEVYMLAS